MTTTEFSNQFDVLYNNITSNQAPGLNEYEKSVFLTKAQEEIVKNYFNPRSNPKGEGFDMSPKRQADFSTLIRTATLTPVGVSVFDRRGLDYTLPSNVFILLNERIANVNADILTAVPISYEEYSRLMQKPYKYPPKNQLWRLIVGKTESAYHKVVDMIRPDVMVSYLGLTFTFLNRSPYNLSITVRQGRPATVVNADDGRADTETNFQPTITINGDLCTIVFTVPSNVSFEHYQAWVINYSGALSDYAAVTFPNDDLEEADLSEKEAVDEGFKFVDAIALDVKSDATIVELIGKSGEIAEYKLRYVKRPNPIILTDLGEEGVSINGVETVSQCELPDTLHDEILQRAIELAKAAWVGDPQTEITIGQRSE